MKKYFLKFLAKKNITEEAFKEMDVSEQADLHAEYLGEIQKSVETFKTITSTQKKEIADLKDQLSKAVTSDDIKKVNDDIEEIALKVAGIELIGGKKGAKRTIKSIISKQVEANKGKGVKEIDLDLVVKADVIFNLFETAGDAFAPTDDPNVDDNILMNTATSVGFAERLQREATILTQISNAMPIRIGDALKVEVPHAENGKPLTVQEASKKPAATIKYKTEKKESVKVAVKFIITEEFQNRADYIVKLVQNYFVSLLSEVLEEAVFDATTGILSYGTAFVTISGLEYKNPTKLDAISAVATTMSNGKYTPSHLVINSVDLATMFGEKGADGHYSLANGGSVALIGDGTTLKIGNKMLQIVEVDTDLLAVGDFVVVDWSKLNFGLGNVVGKTNPYSYMEDNATLYILETAFAVLLPSNYSKAVVSTDFDTVLTAIEQSA